MPGQYSSDIVVETIAVEPFLLPDEVIRIRGKKSMPPSVVLLGLVFCFIPPFIFGPSIFVFAYLLGNKRSGVWITNLRMVDYTKSPFRGRYSIQSIPLADIESIRVAKLDFN